ncbi:MAG: aminopeptidase P family protein [Bacteroidales bacterium]|nr:aminopeptidase P family protein [Bacteroidales bacterium]
MFDKKTYMARRAQLKKDVKSGLIVFPANEEASANYAANTYPFRQDSNFLYFFGLQEPGMVGVIDVDADQDWLYADDLTMDDIIWMGHLPSVSEQAARVGVQHTAPIKDLAELLHKAVLSHQRIHFVNPYRMHVAIKLSKWLSMPLGELAKNQSVELIKAIVKQRSIKTREEVEEIEQAMIVAHQMHTVAMRLCKPGNYEYQVVGAMEGIVASHHGGMSFPPIVSMNGQTLHNHHHDQLLKEGRLMVADAGAEVHSNYCSDVTRTTPVGGVYSTRQKEIYEIVLKANMDTIDTLKPGLPYRDYHLNACKIIASGLKELGLMKGDVDEAVMQGAHALFMPHGLGHMMGLDVHDMENMGENLFGYDDEIKRSEQFGLAYLRLGRKLEPGFVLTVEPGIYFIPALIDLWKSEGKFTNFINYDKLESYKDFGGIRIEDDVLITEKGGSLLGPKIPKTVQEVEEWCGQ